MSETNTPTLTPAAPSAETQNTDAPNGGQPGPIPYERFKEVNDQLAAFKRQWEAMEKAEALRAEQAKKDAEKVMAEQQQWQQLATQREQEREGLKTDMAALSAAHGRYQTALKAILDERRKGMPAYLLTLLDKLDEVEQLEYIAANGEKLAPQAPGTPAPQRRTGPNQPQQRSGRPLTL